MKNRELFIAAHFQSDFFVRLRLQLIREIDSHNQDKDGKWQIYSAAIGELASLIENGSLDRYNLTDDYINEHYGVKDYYEASLISELAFYQAGCEVLKHNANPSLDYLDDIQERMDGGFFMGYRPSKETLSTLVDQLNGTALTVAEKSRDIDRQKGALGRFCQELDKITDEDGVIKKMNHFNDGSYMELWGAVSCLSHYLIEDENWDDYYTLLENLKYFPMQGGIIKQLQSAIDVEAVVGKVYEKGGRKSVQYLLREQWFRKECEEISILKENSELNDLIEEDRTFIKEIIKDIENSKEERYRRIVGIWNDVFGKEELSVWTSSKKAEAERKHEKYGRPELDVVHLISNEINVTSDDVKSFNLKDKGFESLLTFAGTAKDAVVAKSVIEALVEKIFSERSYPDTVLSEKWFEQVRTICRCLDISGENGLELLQRKRKPREGYNVDLVTSMRTERQEAYWLAMLLLSLEQGSDEALFKQYIDMLFRDTRYTIDSLTDDVFAPYYVAELLVSQMMPGLKDEYEKRLIKEIPYLVFVIRVLTGNQGEISDEVKGLLGDRIQREWELERKLLSQNKMAKMEFYDKYVKEYL